MNIVFLTTEAVPYAKTGGLADVCGALPAKIESLGHQCAVIMPAFSCIHNAGLSIETTDISFAIPIGDKLVGARLLKGKLPESNVTVWFIDQPQYFARESLYGDGGGDYPDNAERFAFFARAAMHVIERISMAVDIVHCNDWQSALVPALMRAEPTKHDWISRAASVLTIHNLAYQGRFPSEDFKWMGLDWDHFKPESFEFYGYLNYLKTGIITADMVTTVSPRYAQEIRTPEHGCELDTVLSARGQHVVGIINGIDPQVWDPASDPMLPKNYSVDDWKAGKLENKKALLSEFGVVGDDAVPLIGLVGRLAEQKGWDLILPVLERHLEQKRPTQWVVLGSGDRNYERELERLANAFPNRFALYVGFSDKLAHQIEAASDVFVMPSRYEPCGLNQLYSLRYGTVPVVADTGGLANTVIDCSESTLSDKTATGFLMKGRSVDALDAAIGRALEIRYHDPDHWQQLVCTGMHQDWSWRKSAIQYSQLYEKTLSLNEANRKTTRK